jgi:hypothetical protein
MTRRKRKEEHSECPAVPTAICNRNNRTSPDVTIDRAVQRPISRRLHRSTLSKQNTLKIFFEPFESLRNGGVQQQQGSQAFVSLSFSMPSQEQLCVGPLVPPPLFDCSRSREGSLEHLEIAPNRMTIHFSARETVSCLPIASPSLDCDYAFPVSLSSLSFPPCPLTALSAHSSVDLWCSVLFLLFPFHPLTTSFDSLSHSVLAIDYHHIRRSQIRQIDFAACYSTTINFTSRILEHLFSSDWAAPLL